MATNVDLPEEVIIIGGLPRSGKTMLSNALGSNSQIAIPPSALNFFYWFSEEKFRSRGGFEENLDFFFRSCWKSEAWNLTREMILESGGDRRDLYLVLLESYRRAYFSEKKYVGEYTHVVEEHFDTLVDWFGLERLKFIHPIRNPFDNYASYVVARKVPSAARTPKTHDAFVHKFCHTWGQSTTMGLYRALSYPNSYRVVFFDVFKDDPMGSVESLCGWLGVPVEPERMLNMVDATKPKQNSAFEVESVQEEGIGFVRKDNYDRLRHLNEYEVAAIHAMSCPDLLHAMGYERHNVIVNWKHPRRIDAGEYSLRLQLMTKSYLSPLSFRQVVNITLRHIVEAFKDIVLVFMRKALQKFSWRRSDWT